MPTGCWGREGSSSSPGSAGSGARCAGRSAASPNRSSPFDPQLGQLDAGLFFISYQADPQSFTALQNRLGSGDALNEYIKHVSSAVFAVPGGTRSGSSVDAGLFS